MEILKQIYRTAAEFWKIDFFGPNMDQYLAVILVILIFFALRRILTRFILTRIRKQIEKTQTRIDDEFYDALESPVRFIPIVMGIFVAVEFIDFTGLAAKMADRTVQSLIVFTIFWALFNLIRPLSIFFMRLETIMTTSLVEWLLKSLKMACFLIGASAILEIWGIKVGPIIAGLGLFGVAVALGAQDLFKNLISGILIIAERRFIRGDWIKVNNVVEGTVEKIGFRSTLIRRFDYAPVFVPNSKLSDNLVINFSAMTHRRIYWNINIVYSTTKEQLQKIRDEIEEYIITNPDFAERTKTPVFVHIDKFSTSSIDILIYCFTKTTKWGEWLKIKEELAYKIKEIVEIAGSSFAFPSRSLYVENLPDETPEIYVPPSKTQG